MKLKAMHLFRVLYADPFWRWWGKKVCILAARYYLGIDSIDVFKRRVHIGGRRYERPTQASLLNGKQRRWIKDNEEKVRGVIDEVNKETTPVQRRHICNVRTNGTAGYSVEDGNCSNGGMV